MIVFTEIRSNAYRSFIIRWRNRRDLWTVRRLCRAFRSWFCRLLYK